MAKFDNPLDKLKKLAESENTASGKPNDKRFDNPLDKMSTREMAKATNDRSMAGQYKRKTISLPPGQVRYIKEIAQTERMGVLETYRWLIDMAIRNYEEGERPEVEATTQKLTAKKSHWSSQLE